MKLDELAEVIANGDTTALMGALGQRLVRVPEGWDWENVAGVCECGLLLAELPRTVRMERVAVVSVPTADQVALAVSPAARESRVVKVAYDMTHAHVADPGGRPVCAECYEDPDACEAGSHEAEMCDTPIPVTCSICVDGVAIPNAEHCLDCRPVEPEWDKDRYLGL